MARIRSIKPEFFEDEKLATRCSVAARLLYAGLWVFADDEGRMRASPAYIKASVFPYDELITLREIKAMLDELAQGGFIVLYEAADERLLWIRNFKKHQKIDRPNGSKLPPPPGVETKNSTSSRREVVEPSTRTRCGNGMEGNGGEGIARERASAASPPTSAIPASPASVDGSAPGPAPCLPGWEPLVHLMPAHQPPVGGNDAFDGFEIPWSLGMQSYAISGADALGTNPTPEAAFWSWCAYRLELAQSPATSPPSAKQLRRLRKALEAHQPEPMRRAWLCWLGDAWAATRSPPFALGAFLADDQLAQMLDRARTAAWVPDESNPADWEIPAREQEAATQAEA